MSKMDALRAMREARYAEMTAAKAPTRRPRPPVAPRAAAPAAAEPDPGAETAPDGLCGHRSMNGRTCTREAGHAAKSHRYS